MRHVTGQPDNFAGGKQPYLFVDTVRFWSMFAVVAMHSLVVFVMLGDPARRVWMVVDAPLKFGTIGFFLISGFLLGDKLQMCRPREYLVRRLKRVFVPWLFWYLMLVGYFMAATHRAAHTSFHLNAAEWTAGLRALVEALFGSPLWFVPNLLLGITLLLLFRRFLYHPVLGVGLLVPSLFYAVNIYFVWIPSQHAEALLGFVFYLWLGSYVSHRKQGFLEWLERVPVGLLAGLTLAAGAMAWAECRHLLERHSNDPLNTLRVSNQIFSVLVVLLLAKMKRRSWPRFLHVRREMFGVYLAHTIAILILIRTLRYSLREAQGSWIMSSQWGLGTLWVATIVTVWSACLGWTKLLARWPATRWMVGAVPEEERPTQKGALTAA